MSTRGVADVVFVVDASASMRPCIDALRQNIMSFVAGLDGPNAGSFDLRLEFVALKVDPERATYIVDSSGGEGLWERLYSKGSNSAASAPGCWSTPRDFVKALEGITVGADEDSLMALDFALDLPWRKVAGCHRVAVLLTDEPPETGFMPNERKAMAGELVRKINDLRVKLFMVGPYSATLAELQAADGADFIEISDSDVGRGLASVNFRKILDAIAKSISVSSLQHAPKPVKRALFGQDGWVDGEGFDMNSAR